MPGLWVCKLYFLVHIPKPIALRGTGEKDERGEKKLPPIYFSLLIYLFILPFCFSPFKSALLQMRNLAQPVASFSSPATTLMSLPWRHQQPRGIYIIFSAEIWAPAPHPGPQVEICFLLFPPLPHLCFHQLLSQDELRSPCLLFRFCKFLQHLCIL